METYKEKIANNPKVELVQLSFENSEDAAQAWAESLNQPWPSLLKEDTDGDTLIAPYFPDGRIGLPSYLLIDREGKLIAQGKAAVLAGIPDTDD